MDKWLAALAVLLLLICSVFLLDDLRLIRIPFFSATSQSQSKPIGTLLRTENDVRRRGKSELSWQDSRKGTPLFANDSVLTLSQSGAIIEIGEGARLELGENTLVILETNQLENSDQIRLRFKRGRMAAAGGQGSVESGEWDLKFDASSKFELRSVGDSEMELDVQSGQLTITDQAGLKRVLNQQSVKLTDSKILPLQLDSQLRFNAQSHIRSYQHESKPISVDWQGQALELEVSGPQPSHLPVQSRHQADLELPIGTHQLRLKGQNGFSESLRLEVRKAPVVHLYAPLPRERVLQGKTVNFEWRILPDSKGSELQISKTADFEHLIGQVTSTTGSASYSFDQLGTYFWRVITSDPDGIPIPALYSNQIFCVEDPLEAPEAEPARRFPAEARYQRLRSLWLVLFQIFISQAQAAPPPRSFVFEWKAVAGAQNYVLEIDDDPYFQSPEVITQTTAANFRWAPKKPSTVYWRVAADSKGRMGLFSPVQRADLSKLQLPAGSSPYSVRAEPSARSPAQTTEPPYVDSSDRNAEKVFPPEIVSYEPPAEPSSSTSEPDAHPITSARNGRIWYGPQYASRSYSALGIEEAKLYGLELVNFGIQFSVGPKDWQGQLQGRYTQSKYLVKDKITHPFQKDVDIVEYDLGYSVAPFRSPVELGAQASQRPSLKKTALEAFDIDTIGYYGPNIKFSQTSATWGWGAGSAFLFGNNGFLVPLNAEVWSSPKVLQGGTIGFRFEYEHQVADTSGRLLRVMIPIGYGW